ncbi:MAG TPA: dual specificity protein phosphatase family protein [Chroococcidiopsis sp.]
MYRFAPASPQESIVYGAARPGRSTTHPHSSTDPVQHWLEFMQSQGIQRICCLLPEEQLSSYDHLLDRYADTIGGDRLCWAPITDFDVASPTLLFGQILPFLAIADQRHEKVVVHCAGGIGRTGQILTAWLIAARGYSPKVAIATVKQTGRNPYEAVWAAPFTGRNPWAIAAALNTLFEQCRPTQ